MDADVNKQAEGVLGGITPETIQKLMEGLNRQNRMGQIGAGVAGIGDAIQSVGGIKGGNMDAAEEMLQKNREFGLKTPGMMMEAGKNRYALSKELGGDEPTSQRSFVAQQANLPLLSKMGFKPEEIKAMPASLIDGIRGGAITREDALARIAQNGAYQQASLDIAGATQAQTAANEKTQREQETQRLAQEKEKQGADIKGTAARTLAGQGFFKSLLDAVPFTAGHEARKVLTEQAKGGGPGPRVEGAPPAPAFTAPAPGQTVIHPNGARITRRK
jgi:hypothetical protein